MARPVCVACLCSLPRAVRLVRGVCTALGLVARAAAWRVVLAVVDNRRLQGNGGRDEAVVRRPRRVRQRARLKLAERPVVVELRRVGEASISVRTKRAGAAVARESVQRARGHEEEEHNMIHRTTAARWAR